MTEVLIRVGQAADDPALSELYRHTWSPDTEISPCPPPGDPFFHEASRPEDYLVAELEGRVVGYLRLVQPIPVLSCAHVRQIQGLAVEQSARYHGIGTALINAAIAETRRQGASRLTLRVLSTNDTAQRLYNGTGFTLEGTLHGEFLLDGKHVDDHFMARQV
ncbi:GNAT family N-acetyltransferase [Nocardia seriolae]|uniref:Acetyltransferase n=1 Tax=Nocardia seriolae TaxID=37332 RepID=A0ABC9Z118_9NOCA|nr:GNAT family N-acetyltransferase [Nocardia seriolae]BEK95789.1 GNAT family N-acetyltransferase [Nocardia seriolae]GAM49280.1 acetyltransferase [Nocardia seriolae]GAP31173.1 acetyltransferase [Nocardia seriolae]